MASIALSICSFFQKNELKSVLMSPGAMALTRTPCLENSCAQLRVIGLIAHRDRFAFVIEGTGFLYNMVRTIAGTLIYVGRGKLEPAAVDRALATGDRTEAGPTAPACGLYLLRVLYDEPIFAESEPGPRGRPGVIRFGRDPR